jgi:hypothetical protein
VVHRLRAGRAFSEGFGTLGPHTCLPAVAGNESFLTQMRDSADMDFTESAEHAMLRSAVAGVVGGFGHEYFSRQIKDQGHTHELCRR